MPIGTRRRRPRSQAEYHSRRRPKRGREPRDRGHRDLSESLTWPVGGDERRAPARRDPASAARRLPPKPGPDPPDRTGDRVGASSRKATPRAHDGRLRVEGERSSVGRATRPAPMRSFSHVALVAAHAGATSPPRPSSRRYCSRPGMPWRRITGRTAAERALVACTTISAGIPLSDAGANQLVHRDEPSPGSRTARAPRVAKLQDWWVGPRVERRLSSAGGIWRRSPRAECTARPDERQAGPL